MSLFQAREWWSHRIDADEEFDAGGLAVGNVDNDPSRADKIVTGSLSGLLRIFMPRQQDYQVEDLKLEEDLGAPILQLTIGRFLPGTSANGLAVLHPRKLVVYSVSGEGGVGAAASFFKLTRVYEHSLGVAGLHFTAFNMTSGPFGNASGRDYICVQSMDGQLSFYEQDRASFTRQLERCLVPGPICYVAKTDSIVLATCEMTVESYKYQALAAASLAHPTERKEESVEGGASGGAGSGAGKGGAGRMLKVDWSVNIGEHVFAITAGRCSKGLRPSQVDIVVVGEHTLFCLKESGSSSFRLQKRLDYHPAAVTMYTRPGPVDERDRDPFHNLIVATHTSQLMVYKETTLLWAARAHVLPIALSVATFGGLPGLVVSLSEDGEVRVSYMGTDPPTSVVHATDSKELNYDEMDEEHRRLLVTIRENQSDNRTEPRDKVLLRVQVPTTLDSTVDEEEEWQDGQLTASKTSIAQLTCKLIASFSGTETISNLLISIKVPDAVTTRQSTICIPTLAGGARTPIIVPLVFRGKSSGMPSDLRVKIAAAHTNEAGEPRLSVTEFQLPMCIVCRLVPPLKSNTFKFTLDTNRLPPALPALFDDMFQQPGLTEDAIQRITSSSANMLSFQYFNGADATILVSKSAGRYRIQSGSLEALWLVSSELVRRMNEHFAGDKRGAGGRAGAGEEPFVMVYQEPLPLADFFGCIDEHFECRQNLLRAASELNDRAHQFRVIEKRLLVRFKDRNPAPLNNLDVLLQSTHEQLIHLGGKTEKCQNDLANASNRLSCATHLLLMLMRFRFGLDEDNFNVLKSHLCPEMIDTEDQGWEERIDASMTHLLRTSLAKTAKDTAGVPPPLTMPADTAKLKKHITYVCDRLSKGSLLLRSKDKKASAGAAVASVVREEAEEDD